MICPGLHCPGCSGGRSIGVIGAAVVGLVVADRAVPWVAGRIWWIGGTLAVCFALSVAASMWLEARTSRRAAAWGAARGIYSRADFIAPAAPSRPAVDAGSGRAIAITGGTHVWVTGQLTPEQAAVVRRAIEES